MFTNTEEQSSPKKVAIEDIKVSPKIPFPSCNLILALMFFLTYINLYSIRVSISVAIVVMVNHTSLKLLSGHNVTSEIINDECGSGNQSISIIKTDGEFNWSTHLQGVILGAFFYGYICTQFIGGIASQRFGSKILMGMALFINAVLSLLTPISTKIGGSGVLIAIRILQGLFQGVTFPATHAIIAKWTPPEKRSRIITFCYAGCLLGMVIASPIAGFLAFYSWEAVFYLFGCSTMVCFIFFILFVYDEPNLHPRILPTEKDYLNRILGNESGHAHVSLKELPWRSIFTSVHLFALTCAHFANNWGLYTMLTCLPMYFSAVLNFDIKSNGAISALPYLVSWFCMNFGGFMADMFISKNFLSVTSTRKLAVFIGLLVPALIFLVAAFIKCNAPLAVFCMVSAIGLLGISWAGWSVNHLDLAPLYAGTLMGISNTIATIPGFLGPATTAILTSKKNNRESWMNVFFLASAVIGFGSIMFLIFGSGKQQSWAIKQDKRPLKIK